MEVNPRQKFFQERGYVIIRKFLSEDAVEILKNAFLIQRDNDYYLKASADATNNTFGDCQIPESYAAYSSLCFESLLLSSTPKIEICTGKSLYPTYSYARIYNNGAELVPHLDRPSCEISATICISKTINYPICFAYDSKKIEVELEPGDAIIYSGCDLIHWREKYNGEDGGHMQVFIHYVEQNGPHKDFIFDKRPLLGLPSVSEGKY